MTLEEAQQQTAVDNNDQQQSKINKHKQTQQITTECKTILWHTVTNIPGAAWSKDICSDEQTRQTEDIMLMLSDVTVISINNVTEHHSLYAI